MLHARMVRPPVAGATPGSIDESSIKDIPGARVVRENNFLAVVADKEWDAVKAHQKLKIQWSDTRPPFPSEAELYDHIRKAPVRKREDVRPVGNVDEAFKNAARVIEAEYEWPFQSHACMGPACAVVEIKDGHVTCWSGSQKPHFVRDGIARTLELPMNKVDCIWVVGPGSYGRNDADDCAMDAAVLARLTGKPVRLQYTREQGTGWDPKGPASIHRARAAFDAAGKVVAYEFVSKGFSRIDVQTNGCAAGRHACRPFPRRCRSRSTTTSAFRRNPTCSTTSAPRGRRSGRSSIALRRCAARTCAIRSGRRSTSPASRSWTR